MYMHMRALHTSHTAHCSIACWRTRVCMHPAARSPCVRHIRATPHTREIPNPNPSIRAGRARAGRLQNPSRAGRPCRTSEPSRAGRRPFRSEPSRAEHRQPKIRAVARLGSVRSLEIFARPADAFSQPDLLLSLCAMQRDLFVRNQGHVVGQLH